MPIPLVRYAGRHDSRNDEGQKRLAVGEDPLDVVATAKQHSKDGVADGARRGSTREAYTGFHVADFGHGGAAAAQIGDQLGCPFATPGISGMGNGLSHDDRIDRHALEIVVINGSGFAPGFDGLCQHPLHTFFTNPVEPPRQRWRINPRPVLEEASPIRC